MRTKINFKDGYLKLNPDGCFTACGKTAYEIYFKFILRILAC